MQQPVSEQVAVSDAERRSGLAWRHLLLPGLRTDDVVEIARALVALHSTDPVSVYLSVLMRMQHPDLAAVDEALYESRTLVRHHAMRRTLWVTTPGMARTMHAAATRKVAVTERRRTLSFLAENGIAAPEAWLEDARSKVRAALEAHGPASAREIGRLVPEVTRPLRLAPGTPWETTQSAHSRVLAGMAFDGELVRARPVGTWVNGQYTWDLMERWLPGGVDGEEERTAARDLARTWLGRFGPGTTTDLQWWAGWTLGMTRRALQDCGALPVALEGGEGWLAPDAAGEGHLGAAPAQGGGSGTGDEPWVALLPALDPTVMGWKERAFYLPPESLPAWDRNGNAGPTIWVDGLVVGAWAQRPDGEIRLHWFRDVPSSRRREVEERAAELRSWVGAARFRTRFPGRVGAQLLA